MTKRINKSIALVVLVVLLAASLIGIWAINFANASALDDETTTLIEGIHLSEYMLAMRIGEEAELVATSNYDKLEWLSSDEDIVEVTNGSLMAWAEGFATIKVSADDGKVVASCLVTVLPEGEATLDKDSITFMSVNATAESLTVSLPEGIEAASYEWNSLYPDVASVDPDDEDEAICAINPWRFGSTIITVVVTDTEGERYGASCSVLVTSETFFITGNQNSWIGQPDTKWNLQEVSEGMYSIKASLWSYSGFQIIHDGMDEGWTTKITPWWYDESRSTANYVANNENEFMVTTYGIYNITLDLTDGIAKVYIVFEKAYTTSVGLAFAEDSENYLQYENDFVTIIITALPEGSYFEKSSVKVVVGETVADVDVQLDVDAMEIKVTLISELEDDESVTVPLTVYIGEAYAQFDITVLPFGEDMIPITQFEFSEKEYRLNVNNGEDEAWELPILVKINEDATVKQINYTTDSDNVYVDVDAAGNAKVVAGALGTFTIKATSVGTTEEGEHLTAEATVYVYSDAFYLIGILNGATPNGWTALAPDVESLEGTVFAPYALAPVEGEDKMFSLTTDLNQNDVFSIVFLGMAGNWNGAIYNTFLNAAGSSMDYISYNDVNVQINQRAKYTITLDLSKATPSFTVVYAGEADSDVDVDDLYVYLVRAGGAWDGSKDQEGNVLAMSDVKVDVNEEGGIKSVTFNYDFSELLAQGVWPTIQFVTATEIVDGNFVNATWYGSSVNSVEFSGTAFTSDNGFTNGGYGCQLWMSGSLQSNTVSFTVNFDDFGNITSIVMDYVFA